MDPIQSSNTTGDELAERLWSMQILNDDDVLSVLSGGDDGEGEGIEVDYGVLKEEAVSAQRLSMMRNAALFTKGRAEVTSFDVERPWTNEKMVRVISLIDWVEKEPVELLAAMRRDRVRTRLSAPMGKGKSTILPFYIAREMDHRVLYVCPDAADCSQTNRLLRSRGERGFSRRWSSRVTDTVCCMTYADFCGYAGMSGRAELFKHFETVIFDEGHLWRPDVRASLKIFATMATPTTNLVLCSANVRTDEVSMNMESAGLGNVKVVDAAVSPEEAMASGKLLNSYLADRTLVILPSDERVHDMAQYYRSDGVSVMTLDSATDDVAFAEAYQWLLQEDMVPRVIVAHPRFALGKNLPVSFVILWPLVEDYEVKGDSIEYVERPMPQTMVNQALARAGRGIVDGASGLVMGGERGPEDYYSLVDKVEEFVLLSKAYVKPLHNDFWAPVYKLLPSGMSPMTAQQVTKVNIPAIVAIRYLAKDGLFAGDFVKALMPYAQMDHYLRASQYPRPTSEAYWVEESVCLVDGVVQKVPYLTTGELRVKIHAVAAMSSGKFQIDRWRLPATMKYWNGADSDDDLPDVQQMQMKRLRRVRSRKELPPIPKAVEVRAPWSYEVESLNHELGGPGNRSGRVMPEARLREAFGVMIQSVPAYVEKSAEVNYVQTEEGTYAEVDTFSLVESPGGTEICKLPARTCDKLNSGSLLSIDDFMIVLGAYRLHGPRFTGSVLFDCYSRPWSSICQTLLDERVVDQIILRGVAPHAYQMLSVLNTRFAFELVNTVKNSHLLSAKSKWWFKRKKPTLNKIMLGISEGVFSGVAQSDAYFARVVQLKRWIDGALILAERKGVYLPTFVTEAQRTLPLHAHTNVGRAGAGNILNHSLADVPIIRSVHGRASSLEDNPMSAHYVHRRGDSLF